MHGLLLGTLPTIVGGQLNSLARDMQFKFPRPVFTGDTVRCEVVLRKWDPGGSRGLVEAELECVNQAQVTVVRGRAPGIVRILEKGG
jgi:3-hydroxybutyryl-CoA dehydratase